MRQNECFSEEMYFEDGSRMLVEVRIERIFVLLSVIFYIVFRTNADDLKP